MRGPSDPKATARHIYTHKANYYMLLGVERMCTADDINRKYKRIALQLHPDKAGGDTYLINAFLLAQEAKETLSDPKKRNAYDQYGSDGVKQYESTGRAGPAPRAQHFQRGEAPQDLFDLFFGAQNRARTQQQHHRQQQQQHHQEQQRRQRQYQQGGMPGGQQQGEQLDINLGTMMLAPLLLFVFLILLFSSRTFEVTPTTATSRQASRYNSQDIIPPFHLHPNQKEGCVVKRSLTVGGKKVDYYVKRDFSVLESRNQIDRTGLENSVLISRRDYLRRRCRAEMNKQEHGVGVADMEVCDDLELFKRTLRDRGIHS